jgi:hypothetical protein
VLLDRRVRWQVRMSGGATDELLDLRGARLSGVELAAGATGIELRAAGASTAAVPDRYDVDAAAGVSALVLDRG